MSENLTKLHVDTLCEHKLYLVNRAGTFLYRCGLGWGEFGLFLIFKISHIADDQIYIFRSPLPKKQRMCSESFYIQKITGAL